MASRAVGGSRTVYALALTKTVLGIVALVAMIGGLVVTIVGVVAAADGGGPVVWSVLCVLSTAAMVGSLMARSALGG